MYHKDSSFAFLVCKIMGYSETDISMLKPIKRGIDHQSLPCTKYVEKVKDMHINFTCRNVGLLLDSNDIYLGASADGVVEC